MKIIKHLELLEGLVTEYEERAGRGNSIAAEIRAYAKAKSAGNASSRLNRH